MPYIPEDSPDHPMHNIGRSNVKFPDVIVTLSGVNGNAFILLGIVTRELRRAGHGDQVDAFKSEATSGDYDHLLQTCMQWVNVQ